MSDRERPGSPAGPRSELAEPWVPATRFEGVRELIREIQDESGREVIATLYYRHRFGMPDDLLLDDYSRVDRSLLVRTYLRVLAVKEASELEQTMSEVGVDPAVLADVIPIDRRQTTG